MVEENVLQEAERLIYGPRQATYGHPFDDFSKTGQMWGAILSGWRKSGDPNVPPELVGLCQIAVKISREINAHKRDNIVDIAGYAGTVDMVRERQTIRVSDHDLDCGDAIDVGSGLNPDVRICFMPRGHEGAHRSGNEVWP